jgi:hypothetical protein
MQRRAEDCVTVQSIGSILSEVQESTDVAREASFDAAKRSINAVPVLSAAGLSLSLASGASAAIGGPAADVLTPKTGMSHEITLCEEEITDVSLATLRPRSWRCPCLGLIRGPHPQ